MTDETRADWRAALDDLLRQAMTDRPFHLVYGRRPHHEYAALTETFVAVVHHDDTADYPEPPPLTTAQQLALSVLLGDDIPLGVLLSACEDAGVFADGLAGEIAEKARAEERGRIAEVFRGKASDGSGLSWMREEDDVFREVAEIAAAPPT